MKKFFLYCVLTFFLVGCVADDQNELSVKGKEESPYFVSLEEALKSLEPIYESISATRSESESMPSVRSVEYLMGDIVRTRTTDEVVNPMFYVVNFENDKGFAILSSDKRALPVYAFSDEGSISISDTARNPGLKHYIDGILAAGISPGGSHGTDSIFGGLQPIATVLNMVCEPLLNVNVRKWHQKYPYNKYCPMVGMQRTLVGCAPLALGMICSYFNFPTSFAGTNLNWTSIKNGMDNDVLAKYLRFLGNEENCNADYDTTATGVRPSNLIQTMLNIGFFTELTTFTTSGLRENMENRKPVLMVGQSTGGHAWCVDGLYVISKSYMTEAGSDDKPVYEFKDTYYCHCVWGWSGDSNGYYAYTGTIGGTSYSNMGEQTADYVAPFGHLSMFNKISKRVL